VKSIIAVSVILGAFAGLAVARRPAVRPVGPVAAQKSSVAPVKSSASYANPPGYDPYFAPMPVRTGNHTPGGPELFGGVSPRGYTPATLTPRPTAQPINHKQ
jgi:hypothetical protein